MSTPTRSEAYTILEVDDYGETRRVYKSHFLGKGEGGMQRYHSLRLHPSLQEIHQITTPSPYIYKPGLGQTAILLSPVPIQYQCIRITEN